MIEIQDYIKTLWQPNIVDPVTGEIVSDGTRFTSKRANNFEEGIWTNRELHKYMLERIKRLQIKVELGGRVPGGHSFFDSLDGEELDGLLLDSMFTYAINLVDSNSISVKDSKGFEVGEEYIIFDDENIGFIELMEIKENTLVAKEISETFKKGAIITKDSAKTVNGMFYKTFGNYSVKGSVI